MKTTCKDVLYEYLKQNKGFTKKVHLYVVAEDYSPETVGRDLRQLEEEGKIKVDYYKGRITKRNLAMYAISDYQAPKVKWETVMTENGLVARQNHS